MSDTELTAELIFEGGNFMCVLIKSMESFHWLLGFTNQRPLTDGELEVEKNKALRVKLEIQLDEAHQEAISVVCYPKYGNKEAVKKAEAEILEATFKILQNTPDVARVLDYSKFCVIYKSKFPSKPKDIDLSDDKQFRDFVPSNYRDILITLILTAFGYLTWNRVGENAVQISVSKQASESTNISKNTELKERVTTEEPKVRNDLFFLPNEDKPFTGRWETYYPNGKKRGLSHFKDGKFNGLVALWFENGQKESEENLTDGKLNGLRILWNENGQKISEINYKDGAELQENIKKKGKEKSKVNAQDGFGLFQAEAETVKIELKCPNSVDSDITPPLFDGAGALYGCILGEMQTVKWFINEIPNSNRVSNVKFLWNDWFTDMGYGLHPDKQEAQKALNVLIKLYAPEKEKVLHKVFFANSSKTITSARFTLNYTYDRGPAIDERMIVVTRTKNAVNP